MDKGAIAADIVRRLRKAGHEALFAGGCVRDRLLGRMPLDYDVATSAPPEAVRALFPRTVAVGAQFGVIIVLDRGARVEVATFRSDDAYIDGRRPSAVHYGNAREDAERRDFTINALYQDPFTDEVHDWVGGQADLAAGIVRTVGDAGARIAEDRLRMLRAVRFAARLGFRIDDVTMQAIRAAAPTVVDMAAERIGDELVKMLCEGAARRAFELLDETGLLAVVLPAIDAMKGVMQSSDFHPEGDVFVHTLLLLAQLPAGAPETLALGALLHDVAKPVCVGEKNGRITFYGHESVGADMAVEICRGLRRSRATWERVDYLVRNHLRLAHAKEMRLSTLKRLLATDGFEELARLVRLDTLASSCDLGPVVYCERRRSELAVEELEPPRLLSGDDLLAMGYAPGPALGRMLRELVDAQLEGTVRTSEEASAWVRERFPAGTKS